MQSDQLKFWETFSECAAKVYEALKAYEEAKEALSEAHDAFEEAESNFGDSKVDVRDVVKKMTLLIKEIKEVDFDGEGHV